MNFGEVVNLPKSGNYILFNTIYHNRTDDPDIKDVITLVFKDLDTGEKIIKDVENPKIEVYVAKKGIDLGEYTHIDIDEKDTELVDCSYKSILKDLSEMLGYKSYYNKCMQEKRYDDAKRIMEVNRIFSSDRNIEDFYKFKSKQYFGTKELKNITKGFYDIETDLKKGYCDLKNGCGTAPINALTFINPQTKESYTLALRDSSNPKVKELEDNKEAFLNYVHELCDEIVGTDYEYKLAFFDDELELIKVFFDLVNLYKLDFMLAWNQSFDISYIIDRIKRLGSVPEEVMCHPDFKYKKAVYLRDNFNFEIKKKSDQVILSSYSVFMDQMLNYASVRKSQSSIDSYKLDDIGLKETGIGKLDYSDICNHIRDLPEADYVRFLAYNIRDVLTQVKIEEKTNDIIDIAYRAYSYNTRYSKIFKEITFLTDVAFEDFLDTGIVLGNNVNAIKYNRAKKEENLLIIEGGDDDDEDGVRFRGALVGNGVYAHSKPF